MTRIVLQKLLWGERSFYVCNTYHLVFLTRSKVFSFMLTSVGNVWLLVNLKDEQTYFMDHFTIKLFTISPLFIRSTNIFLWSKKKHQIWYEKDLKCETAKYTMHGQVAAGKDKRKVLGREILFLYNKISNNCNDSKSEKPHSETWTTLVLD